MAARMTVGAETTWLDRRVKVLGTVAPPFFLGAFPLILLVWILYLAGDSLAVDFRHELWPGGRAVLDGLSPYPPLADVQTGARFVFPAPAALLMAPIALLPLAGAVIVFTVLVACAGFLTLRVLGVTDWRVYGAALLWAPVVSAVQTANLTLLLALAAALVWRYRDRAWLAGAALGAAVALKLILWPLFIWLLATRRYKASAVSLAVAAAFTAASFAVVGHLDYYVDVARELDATFAPKSYTPYALALKLGASAGVAHVIGYAIAATSLLAVWRCKSFTLAIFAVLLASPVVWLHYFALLIVPMAILRPRFSPLWLLPLLAWPAPGTWNGHTWQTALMLAVLAATALALLRAASKRPASA